MHVMNSTNSILDLIKLLYQLLHSFFPGSTLSFVPSSHNLSGQVWVVTGGTSGIGLATATNLAKLGATVWIVARSRQRALVAEAHFEEHTRQRPRSVICDFEDLSALKPAVAELVAAAPVVHGVIHSAATAEAGTTRDGFARIFQVNNLAPYYLQRLLDPWMASSAKTQGRVVWTTAQSHWLAAHRGEALARDPTQQGRDEWECYDTSKAVALMIAQRQLPFVRSVAVSPGLVPTKLFGQQTRSAQWFRSLFEWPVEYASVSQLAAALGEFEGGYVVPWGREGVGRPDIVGAQGVHEALDRLLEGSERGF